MSFLSSASAAPILLTALFALEPVQELPLPADQAELGNIVPRLEYYAPVNPAPDAGALIVFPGGGYAMRAQHEAEPVARRFAREGIHAFVLHYRVAPNRHPLPLKDAATAVAFVRQNAKRFGIAPDKIAVLGFSAGGHLAGSASVLFEEAQPLLEDSLKDTSARPDAQILCYAVINGHTGSFTNLYGAEADETEFEHFSLDRHVTKQTPPAFVWHTAEDPVVDVENAYSYVRALRKHSVPYELHVFPYGTHGLGLVDEAARERRELSAAKYAEVAIWSDLAASWLKRQGW